MNDTAQQHAERLRLIGNELRQKCKSKGVDCETCERSQASLDFAIAALAAPPAARIHTAPFSPRARQTRRRRRMANRVFVDMDGVIVDFDAFKTKHGLTGEEVKRRPSAYLEMEPIPGALSAVRSLIGMGYEVWIATKPPTGIAFAYMDKAQWILNWLPDLKRRIIITHDKGLLGDEHDYLCDDRPHKANCERFAGTLVSFVNGYHWPQALDFFRAEKTRNAA